MNLDEERKIKEAFDDEAHSRGFCLDQEWSDCENPYLDGDTNLAFDFFKSGWQAAKAQEAEKLKGCVVVPVEPTREIREAMYMAQHYHMAVVNPDEWDAVDKSYKAMIEAARSGK